MFKLLAKPFLWAIHFYVDWRDLRVESMPIAHRSDDHGGYFWGTTPETKKALRLVMEQINKQDQGKCKPARFGGIYVYGRSLDHQVYEALMHQGGYFIANYCQLMGSGPSMRIIDT